MSTVDLAGGIIQIDTDLAGIEGLSAGFLVPGERPALVEPGPATVASTLVERLKRLGVGPEDLSYIVASHIHLDHAGGAGDLIETFPNAQVIVHREGARHMVDPTKLMASAYRVFGDSLDRLFGPLRAVPADRLRAVDPGDTIDLGAGRSLEVVEATGHARHHMGLLDSESGAIFVGDAMGVYLPEADLLRPATPPPDFNLDLALATLQRFRERQPTALYLTHFGPAPADRDMLAVAEERLRRYGDIVREAMKETEDVDVLAARLEAATMADHAAIENRPELQAKFEALNAFRSSAAGYLRYFQSHH